MGKSINKGKENPMYKHGLSGHPIHRMWSYIIGRCEYNKNPSWEYYGHKGVKIHPTWRNDFKAFYDYVTALPEYGKSGMTLDRINSDGDYEPGNLRWANEHLQKANRRKGKDNTTGFVGVTKRGNVYESYIGINKELISFGYFKTIIEAANARNLYIIKNGLWEYPIQNTLIA